MLRGFYGTTGVVDVPETYRKRPRTTNRPPSPTRTHERYFWGFSLRPGRPERGHLEVETAGLDLEWVDVGQKIGEIAHVFALQGRREVPLYFAIFSRPSNENESRNLADGLRPGADVSLIIFPR